MRWARWFLRASLLAIPALLLFVRPGGSQESAGAIGFTPGQPVAGRRVVFTMSGSALAGSGYRWDFGDGTVTNIPAPIHVYSEPGVYNIGLTVDTESGPVTVQRTVEVLSATTLRLNGGRFDVSMTARDQRTERTGEGQAIPENDLFGYFSIPALTSQPDNPEMFVKILDARTVNGQFWVFYNGLTDLDVTLTVRENPTGIVKTYRKDPGSACGGFDTSGFIGGGATPTATPTPPGGSTTPTVTPTGTGTQTVTINVRAWDFSPGGPVSAPVRLQVGVNYRLVFHNVDPAGTANPRHGFSGISDLGLPGNDNISRGGPDFVIPSFLPQPFHRGTHPFGCTQNDCGGDPEQHVGMVGFLIIE
ncbi:MAG: PKD domain-containing protein [Thermoanaerobaculia bacterium]|nr:PKD domain-containing protein [Thermoanaerobaculia bacterium]